MGIEFYIADGDQQEGPFDAMSMVRKIRNGKISADTMIYVDNDDVPIRAGDIPDLKSFLNEPIHDVPPADEKASVNVAQLSVYDMLADAWRFFSDNQTMSLVAGVLTIASVVVTFVLTSVMPGFMSALISSIVTTLMMYLFIIYTARKVKDQSTDPNFFIAYMARRGVDLVPAAAIVGTITTGIPAMMAAFVGPAGYVMMLLGMVAFMLFIFTPLFLLFRPDLNFLDAIKASLEWTIGQGAKNILILVGLMLINMVATLIFFVPVFVSLPVTCIALTDLYLSRIHFDPNAS